MVEQETTDSETPRPMVSGTALLRQWFADDVGLRELLAQSRQWQHFRERAVRGQWSRFFAADSTLWIILAGVLALGYVGWMSQLSLRLYNEYGSPPFDLSVFDQGLWLLSHFRTPFVTVMGRNLFGDHASFILILVAPLYRLVPEPQGILVLQTVLIASPVWPIYVLAKRYLGHGAFAAAFVAVYLFNPIIQLENIEQFHPEAFKVALVAWALYAALESRWRLLLITSALILLVKEDAANVVVPLGVWVYARRSRRLGSLLVAGSVVFAAVDNWILIPTLLGGSSFYSGQIPFGGVTGILATLGHRPGQLWSYLVVRPRLWYLYQLGAPLTFFFAFAPGLSLIALAMVAQNVFATSPYVQQINYHYSMAIVPILTIASILALTRPRLWPHRVSLTVMLVASALWSCSVWGMAPFSTNKIGPAGFPGNEVAAIVEVTSSLPAAASVSAWYPFVAHFDRRPRIYVWPAPVTTADWGRYNDPASSSASAAQASRTLQYLLLPTKLSLLGSSAPDFRAIARYFHVVRESNGIALFQRNGGNGVVSGP